MLGTPSPDKGKRVSSRFSHLKQRVSSVFSRSSPEPRSSPTHSRFPPDNTEQPDVPAHDTESQPLQPPKDSHHRSERAFSHAQNFVMKDPVFIDNSTTTDNFMKDFLQHTIIGAEFDSSARDPPPRCHPGTRLAIIQRCLDFIVECTGEEKLRWVVGPAGVGKSAIMQIVTEKAPAGVIFASVFLSVNGRRDASKTIITIAYQLAVKCGPYRQFIRDEINLDPSLLQKSLSRQFNKFIVEPFIHRRLFDPLRRFLVVIDGLDESDNPLAQQNLLELISDFCISYPASPIAWIIASRPEPHITSFFDRVEGQLLYFREDIRVDSDEACQDIQRYLRDELNRIKLAYPSLRHKREWPSELEFTMIASAAGGLFAYASTVVRYIDNPLYRVPTTQLRHVLEAIGDVSQDGNAGRDHPMAQLDALYARILSNIPDDIMITTRKILLLHSNWRWNPIIGIRKLLLLYEADFLLSDFRSQCNLLGLTEDTAYGAISHLCAVMRVPEADKADHESLQYFHKSFEDFLFDSKRSGFSLHVHHGHEAEQLVAHISLQIVEQVPHGPAGLVSGDGIDCVSYGILQGGPGICDNISLSWPGDERSQVTDADLKLYLYRNSMFKLCHRFQHDRSTSCESMPHFQVLTTHFSALGCDFPALRLRDYAFDKFRHELSELGQLKQVPLRTFDYAAICGTIDLRFTSPKGMNVELSVTWNPFCEHSKQELDDLQELRGWETAFERPYGDYPDSEDNESEMVADSADTDPPRFDTVTIKACHKRFLPYHKERCRSHIFSHTCDYCSRLLARHFISNPDVLTTVFVDSTGLSYVEFSFIDPDDGVSEWRYRFCHSGPPTFNNT